MSNRCGHNPDQLRTCDLARRGKRGQPPLIGRISARLNWAVGNPGLLKALHNLNSSGRRKRSERVEVCISVMQYLVTKWLDLATRRCARPGNKHGRPIQDYLAAPTAAHLASRISREGSWKGSAPLTVERVHLALQDLEAAGYITRLKQTRTMMDSGSWVGHPKIISMCRQFFEDLGGRKLWREIRAKGKERFGKMQGKWQHIMERAGTGMEALKTDLADYLNPGLVLSPGQVAMYHQQAPPGKPILFREIRFIRGA